MVIACRWAKFRVAGAALLAVALTACATAPVQEMSDARQAIAAARQAGAAQQAPAELAVATRYLQTAERALQRHDFGQARESAQKARQAATGALDMSRRFDADEKKKTAVPTSGSI
ncbi:MAG TPA: DUF4398 domain-containing protein [Gammaproteobacteria bacterium]|nr:DUF4398 domain-containing protein [Gammaproteobacteria bacterium]HET7588548.1 DUF4398 domain-containing protein [Gammaproteobacteria bacterium]